MLEVSRFFGKSEDNEVEHDPIRCRLGYEVFNVVGESSATFGCQRYLGR